MENNGVFLIVARIVCCLHWSSAESGFFWHATDFHYDPTYWTSQLSCNGPVPRPGLYGSHRCDANWNLVNDSITNMALIKPDVDFVIWTGDTIAHIPARNKSLAGNVDILQQLTTAFKSAFPSNVQFLPSLGNHDFYPTDQANVKRDELYNKTADVWKDWITDADQLEQFMNGGFYTMPVSANVKLLSLNTNLYFYYNRITESMADPAGQFSWMESELDKARKNQEKVIIAAHVPPGVVTPYFISWMYPNHHKRYVEILTKYSDVIMASHCGHDHSDGFKMIQDDGDRTKAVPLFVAPAVAPNNIPLFKVDPDTPWKFRLYSLNGRPHNPGVRLVEYDRVTGRHINYVQFFINLTDTNMNKQTNWRKLYDFTDAYNVSDMSVASLRKIFDRMKSDGGEKLAQTYCNNALVSKEDKPCSRRNRFEIVCGGQYYKLDEANKCVDEYLIGSASLANLHFAGLLVSFIVTITSFH